MVDEILIQIGNFLLPGRIYPARNPKSWVIFAHGRGSSHKSLRNNRVAKELASAGHATVLFDLLTLEEDTDFKNRFDVYLLSQRLLGATEWLVKSEYYKNATPIAYFGASTGAAAALQATANAPENYPISTIISRGGRPDLVDEKMLKLIQIPTLLIIGGEDQEVIKLNEYAAYFIHFCEITVIPKATHLFEEPGTLEQVTKLTIKWLDFYTIKLKPKLLENESHP